MHCFAGNEVGAGEGVIRVVAVVQGIFATNAESLERLEHHTEVGSSLRLSAYTDILHINLRPSVFLAFIGAIRCSLHAISSNSVATLVEDVTDNILTFPSPITEREHSIEFQPLCGSRLEFQLQSHVLRSYSVHVDISVRLISQSS